MERVSLKKERSVIRKKVYELTKFLLKTKNSEDKVQDVFQKVAEEFRYETWQCVEQVYRQLRKVDKDPLPLFKKKRTTNK